MLCYGNGGFLHVCQAIYTWPHLFRNLVGSFPICHKFTVLSCACHSIYLAEDQVSDLDGMEFDRAIMESGDPEFVECLP